MKTGTSIDLWKGTVPDAALLGPGLEDVSVAGDL